MTKHFDDITKEYKVGDRLFSVSECRDYHYQIQRESKYDTMVFVVHEKVGVNTWVCEGKIDVCISSRFDYGDNFDEDDIIEMLDEEFEEFIKRIKNEEFVETDDDY